MNDPTPLRRPDALASQSDADRLRILAASMRRRMGAIDATRHNLAQILKAAEEMVEIMDRQDREAA